MSSVETPPPPPPPPPSPPSSEDDLSQAVEKDTAPPPPPPPYPEEAPAAAAPPSYASTEARPAAPIRLATRVLWREETAAEQHLRISNWMLATEETDRQRYRARQARICQMHRRYALWHLVAAAAILITALLCAGTTFLLLRAVSLQWRRGSVDMTHWPARCNLSEPRYDPHSGRISAELRLADTSRLTLCVCGDAFVYRIVAPNDIVGGCQSGLGAKDPLVRSFCHRVARLTGGGGGAEAALLCRRYPNSYTSPLSVCPTGAENFDYSTADCIATVYRYQNIPAYVCICLGIVVGAFIGAAWILLCARHYFFYEHPLTVLGQDCRRCCRQRRSQPPWVAFAADEH